MSKKVLRIRLGTDGSVKAEVEGVKGTSCEEVTAFLDELFGDPTSRNLKEEYYEDPIEICDGLPEGYCG